MKTLPFTILRISMAITFLWISVLIFIGPEIWSGYINQWAADLLPIPLTQAMLATAVLDALIGLMLLLDLFTWGAALLGSVHILTVLITSGITDITVRDIGLLGGAIAIFINSLILERDLKKYIAGPLTP